jgi:hypothetical protein
MKIVRLLVPAIVALALVACGGGSSSSSSSQASPGADAAAASAAPASAAPAAAASADSVGTEPPGQTADVDVPVYPGAVKMPTQVKPMKWCGHTISMAVYHAPKADLNSVMTWYASKLPGATKIMDKTLSHGPSSSSQAAEMISGDGRQVAFGMEMHVSGLAAKYAADVDGTTISVGTYDPPISPDDLALMMKADQGDAAAKAQAIAAVKAKCGANFTLGG